MPQAEKPGFIRVDHRWTSDDWWSAIRCRLGRFGPHSRVVPGLYAKGRPDPGSPVLATTNYRLTFDLLRRGLAGLDCWILVLDARGLGVGAAVAAGLFSTDELVLRVNAARLARAVSHRTLLLPPRGAGVIDAGLVARSTGFEVQTGRLPQTEPRLGVLEALVLTPVEMGRSLMRYPAFVFAALLFAGLGPSGVSIDRAFAGSWPLLLLGLASVVCGSLLAPLLHALFPRIPLWCEGGAAGLAATAALMEGARFAAGMDAFLAAACWIFFPAASAAMAMQFALSMPSDASTHGRKRPVFLLSIGAALSVLTLVALTASKASHWMPRP